MRALIGYWENLAFNLSNVSGNWKVLLNVVSFLLKHLHDY